MNRPQVKTSQEAKISQAKTNQGEYMAEKPTDLMLTDLMTTPTEPTDLDVTNKEGQI